MFFKFVLICMSMREFKFIIIALLLMSSVAFAQKVNTEDFNYMAPVDIMGFSYIKNTNGKDSVKGKIHEVINKFAKEQNRKANFITDSKLNYNKIISSVMEGSFGTNRIDFVGGIYYDEQNLRYLKYVNRPIAQDNFIVVYRRDLKNKYVGLNDFEKLVNSSANLIVIDGQGFEELLTNKSVASYNDMKTCLDRIMKKDEIFVGSERNLKSFILNNPEYKDQIVAFNLKRDGKILTRRLYFAFNRDFLDMPENADLFKNFFNFLKNY